LRRDPLASSANGWYVTFGCHPPSRQGTEVPRRETGCGNGDGVSESDSHCHGVSDRRPDVWNVGSRPEGHTGERLTVGVADPDSWARPARAGRGPPDAGGAAPTHLRKPTRRRQLTSTTKKKKIFSSLGPRIRPLDPQERGWTSASCGARARTKLPLIAQ
jgi:hypothetical protein